MPRKKSKKKVSRVSNRKCSTEHCQNSAYYVNSLLCHACYSAEHYWLQKSVTERSKRKQKLLVYQDRMEVLTS